MSWFDELVTPRLRTDDLEKPMASGHESLATAREALHTARCLERKQEAIQIGTHAGSGDSNSSSDESDDGEYYTADFTEESQSGWRWEDSNKSDKINMAQPPKQNRTHTNNKSLTSKNKSENLIQNQIDSRLSLMLETTGKFEKGEQANQQFKHRIALEPKISNTLNSKDFHLVTGIQRKEKLGELRVIPKKNKIRRGSQKRLGGLDAPSSAAILLSEDLPVRPIFDPFELTTAPISSQHNKSTSSKSGIRKSSQQSQLKVHVPNLHIPSGYGWGVDNDDGSDSDESVGSVSSTRSTASTASARSRILSARAYATMERMEGNHYRSSKSAPSEPTFAFPQGTHVVKSKTPTTASIHSSKSHENNTQGRREHRSP